MKQIARCDWLPERARRSHLARSRLPALSRKQNFTKRHIINPLLTKFVRSRWLAIGLVLFLRLTLIALDLRVVIANRTQLPQYYYPFFHYLLIDLFIPLQFRECSFNMTRGCEDIEGGGAPKIFRHPKGGL